MTQRLKVGDELIVNEAGEFVTPESGEVADPPAEMIVVAVSGNPEGDLVFTKIDRDSVEVGGLMVNGSFKPLADYKDQRFRITRLPPYYYKQPPTPLDLSVFGPVVPPPVLPRRSRARTDGDRQAGLKLLADFRRFGEMVNRHR